MSATPRTSFSRDRLPHGGGAKACPYPSSPTSPNQARLFKDGNAFLKKWVRRITHSKAWTGHSAIFITWDEGAFSDVSPFGPVDLRGGPDSPILPATPADPSTGGGGDLAGGTVYGGGHVPMIVVAAGVGHRTADSADTPPPGSEATGSAKAVPAASSNEAIAAPTPPNPRPLLTSRPAEWRWPSSGRCNRKHVPRDLPARSARPRRN